MKNNSTSLFLENQLCFPLYAASKLTTKLYAPFLKTIDLTYPQYLVMLVLWEHEIQSVSEIGDKILLASNTLTPLLKRMESKDLINRKRSKEDERTVMVSLTKKGAFLKEEASEIPSKILAIFQSEKISETDLRGLQQTLFDLIKILNEKVID